LDNFSRKIFGPKRVEITQVLRRLHNEEHLSDLYCSPNFIRVIKSRKIKCAGHVARVGDRRGAYRVSVGRSEGRRPLGRPGVRWEDNIKMDFQDVGWGCMDWTDVAEVGTCSGRL
jgi:hypothetical protein